MLGLKLETDPHWVNIVEKNIEEILTDHAWCEQKAATNAISIMISYPYHSDLVDELLSLAKEELSHFEMVHQKIKDRGYKLGFERRDEYVNELYKFMRKGHKKEIVLIDRLLFSAMVEARSCERFRILSLHINDLDLREFYHELMISEANHYTTFLAFARKYGNAIEDVNARWQQWLDYEANVVKSYGKSETIHG
ncbi:tRNA 2-methylthio-N6-isopentenyl adenosine(37) hydroxylase MiaE [Sphingobacteriaceae bacterium]|nr:tRNA 2-methylthio-N6-isopentenyl adenosine(37) hydroxylase MiaE [Sphingobacteriaceae bacterium]